MEYRFRKAEMQDLEEVVSLYHAAIADMEDRRIYQWDEIYPNEEIIKEDINNSEMQLLTKEERIIACVVINEEQDEEYQGASWKYTEGMIAVIHRLCVHPNEQGCGVGKRILKLTEKLMKDRGYRNIRLDVFSENPYANRLYQSMDYRFVGNVHFRKGLFYLFEKKLLDQGIL